MATPGGNALYAAVGANIWSGRVGISAVVGYDWPPEYTDTLNRSAVDTRGLIQKDAETLRAWTIYELSGYRRYFSRNTEVVLLTPSPFSSTPLTAAEAAAFTVDAKGIDGAVNGVGWLFRRAGSALRGLQTGYVRNYGAVFTAGILVVLVWLIARGM